MLSRNRLIEQRMLLVGDRPARADPVRSSKTRNPRRNEAAAEPESMTFPREILKKIDGGVDVDGETSHSRRHRAPGY